MEETITITLSRYKTLVSYEYDGLALANGGVDNWEWYGDSFGDFAEENGTEEDWIEKAKEEDRIG